MRNQNLIIGIAIAVVMTHGICYAAVNPLKTKPKQTKAAVKQKRLKIKAMTDYDGAWVANIETDVYSLGTYENLTAGYSANNGWNFSLSLLNAQFIGNNNVFQGETFFNLSKTIALTRDISITLGSQNGIALTNAHPQTWFNFDFLDSHYVLNPMVLLHGGTYLANKAITGKSRQVGFLAGLEITFIPDQLALQMEYISGHQSLSGANISLLYNLTPNCQLYLGVLVPEQRSGNEFAGIMGFNFSTLPL